MNGKILPSAKRTGCWLPLGIRQRRIGRREKRFGDDRPRGFLDLLCHERGLPMGFDSPLSSARRRGASIMGGGDLYSGDEPNVVTQGDHAAPDDFVPLCLRASVASSRRSVLIHPLVLEQGLVQPGHIRRGDDLRRGTSRCAAGAGAPTAPPSSDSKKTRLNVVWPSSKRTKQSSPLLRAGGGGEDDDVALAVFRGHAVAVHAGGEGVVVVHVRAADVIVGHAFGIRQIGEILRDTRPTRG